MALFKSKLERAEEFIWLNARLLDRYLFQHLFYNGPKDQVIQALAAYQNIDGGFGNALEPDLRGPVSQPQSTEIALHILHKIQALSHPMVTNACTYLQNITTREGGVPYMHPSALAYPRAPWWQTTEQPSASLNPTAALAGLLHAGKVQHPWLEQATRYCWQQIEQLETSNMYEMRAILLFLEYVPELERANKAREHMGKILFEQKLVALNPYTHEHLLSPLEYAPTPESKARHLFSDSLIEQHLDVLIESQQDDGSWQLNWEPWSPLTKYEWRGWLTINNIALLQAYGRGA